MAPTLRIGTRRSALALAQAREVAGRLAAFGAATELVEITTSGDRGADAGLRKGGRKGLFVAEIVKALQDKEVDVAVHSAKDLPAEDPPGVVVAAVPKRVSPLDVLVMRSEDLPEGAVVGTSSLRRKGQLARWRPDLQLRDLRGNVDTRLRKLDDAEYDGVVLAAAGLARLGIEPPFVRQFAPDEMLPAPGQGALAVHAREDDRAARRLLERLDHPDSRDALIAERRLMREIGGGCSLPLGGYATIRYNPRAFPDERRSLAVTQLIPRVVDLRAAVFDPEPGSGHGTDVPPWLAVEVTEEHPHHAGIAAAEALLAAGAGRILERVRGG